jgi:hypothetical protein
MLVKIMLLEDIMKEQSLLGLDGELRLGTPEVSGVLGVGFDYLFLSRETREATKRAETVLNEVINSKGMATPSLDIYGGAEFGIVDGLRMGTILGYSGNKGWYAGLTFGYSPSLRGIWSNKPVVAQEGSGTPLPVSPSLTQTQTPTPVAPVVTPTIGDTTVDAIRQDVRGGAQ